MHIWENNDDVFCIMYGGRSGGRSTVFDLHKVKGKQVSGKASVFYL